MDSGRFKLLGSNQVDGGAVFSVYSRASELELVLFDQVDDARPARVLPLNRTYHYWHGFVKDLRPGQLYAFRSPESRGNLLLDPYARAVAMPSGYDRKAGEDAARSMKSVLVDHQAYDWEGDLPLQRPVASSVIYEMHVGGFTRHPNSGVADHLRGTYRGMAEKIPYLKALGVTAVELLPIFQFDPTDAPGGTNYWGYSPISFFAPHSGYCSSTDYLAPLNEFRDLVKALHRAGIEVILDVVYNHTAEGDHSGPVFCFKGLANSIYYLLEEGRYANFSGTGNALNTNHTVVRRLILDSLRYWVQECHVDGFRFDLASVLSRDESGRPSLIPPVLWDIESDPVLAGTKLIAESWDASGLYQLGNFVGDTWQEWNGQFRDDVRSFIKGDHNLARTMVSRLLGSPDIFAHELREAEQSVNFVTCHDGFTLNDLVSYSQKDNWANGEENRDGANDNRSWNCGVDGPSQDSDIESLRVRQIKNLLLATLLSVGTPMLLMGDEVRRTQRGNNNAYCQDNELSWFDWDLAEVNAGLLRFTRQLVDFRARRDPAPSQGYNLTEMLDRAHITMHGIELDNPDWSPDSHSLALTMHWPGDRYQLHWMLNAFWQPLVFQLPPGDWRRWIDTFLPSPQDIQEWSRAPKISSPHYQVEARTNVVLFRRA